MSIDSFSIGKRVLEIRKEFKLSREAFGLKIGVQGSVIRNIEENNNKKINEPLLISISAQYGINKEWLLYGKGDKYIRTKSSLMDELVNTYNLGFYGEQIIRTYLDLPDDKKAVVEDFFEQLIKNSSVDTTLAAARGNSKLEIIADDDAVRKDLENYKPPTDL